MTDLIDSKRDLDDKLREILTELQADTAMRSGWDDPNEVTDLQEGDRDRAIAQIHQAFEESGEYVHINLGQETQAAIANTILGNKVMTGQEWLDRFKDEVTKIHPEDMLLGTVIEAAKRAAGIEK